MIRRLLSIVSVLALSMPVWAELSEDARLWGEGPVTLLMTDDERAEWKSLDTDRAAAGFIALFWARRDPTPETPANEFREEFIRRIQYSDQNFSFPGKPGSSSERGRVFMILGPPSRIQRTAGTGPGALSTSSEEAWIYEGDKVPPFADGRAFQIRFVDQYGSGDFQIGRSLGVNVTSLLESAVDAILVSPDLTELPNSSLVQVSTDMPPVEDVVPTTFESQALGQAVDTFKRDGRGSLADLGLHYDESVTADGTYFVPLQLWLENGGAIEDALVFFGTVENEDGEVVRVWEQEAVLTPDGDAGWFDHSLMIQPGHYRGIFGLAEGDEVIAISETKLDLEGVDPEGQSTSKLILSKRIEPLAEAQQPTDPFAFGGLKVVPQGNRTFTTTEELWYFLEIRNPGLKEVSTGVPDGQMEVPAATSDLDAGATASETESQGVPALQIKLDLEGKDSEGKPVRMSAPSMPAQAQELKGVPGHYATGSSIPLAGFRPGEYTLKVRLFDSVAKKTWNYEESFRIAE